MTTDEIKRKVNNRLLLDDRVIPANISVEVHDATVKLTGTVTTYTSFKAAEEDALYVPGVEGVENELSVMFPAELSVPTDQEIADRIQSIFSWNENLKPFDLSVQVDHGWVTLEGSVNSFWKKLIAEDLAYTVTGVIDISNEITIVPSGDATDESIAENIKNSIKLRGDVGLEGIDIKVQDGVVTLSGVADNHSEALAAYDAAIYTRGVVHVNDELTVLRDALI